MHDASASKYFTLPIDLRFNNLFFSGRTLQFFEPLVTSQEIILTGRLGMNAATGALMIGPIFDSKESANVPLLLLSPSPTDLGIQNLFNEVVLVRRPRLVVAVTSDETSTVCAFGQW